MSKAKMTYEEMISKLQAQTYSAPDSWEAIAMNLDLNDHVSQLKLHRAPEDLWGKIDAELELTPEVAKEVPRKINSKAYLIAASIVLVAAVFWTKSSDVVYDISYSSEVIETTIITTSTAGPLNPEFLEAINFIDQNDFLYSAKDKLDYEKQMTKLEDAEKEVRQMQEQYGVDKSSQKMLAKIEREKSELIKSMIKGA